MFCFVSSYSSEDGSGYTSSNQPAGAEGVAEPLQESVDAHLGTAHVQHFAVAVHLNEYAQDMLVGDAALQIPLVVAANDVVVFPDPHHAVEHILPVVAFEQGHIEPMEAFGAFFLDDHKVMPLAQKWHHGRAYVGVNEASVAV